MYTCRLHEVAIGLIVVDKNGNEIISLKYDTAASFSDGLARVSLSEKCGFVDSSGNEAIPLIYDRAAPFSDGYASVGMRRTNPIGNWRFNNGIIDKNGMIIVPLDYSRIDNFDENLLRVTKRRQMRNSKATDVLYGVFDRTSGAEVIPCTYSQLSIVEGLIRAITLDGAEYIFDKFGNRIG